MRILSCGNGYAKVFVCFGVFGCRRPRWGASPARIEGTYNLVPNDATQQFCRRHHLPLPTGRLTLRPDRTFTFVCQDDEGTMRTRGVYEVDGDRIELEVEDGPAVHLASRLRFDDSGLHGRNAEFDRDEPVIQRPVIRRMPPIPAPPAPPARTVCDVKGTWTLRRANTGLEDRSTRFTFDPNGTFRYIGENSSCRGTYVVTLDGIELTYTEIDGGPTDPQASNRKLLPVAFENDAFYVDNYRYERATSR